MSYSYYASLTIDSTKVVGSANHTDFPILVKGTYDGTDSEPDIRTTANSGHVQNTASGGASGSLTVPADLVFSPNTDGSSPYDFEISKYDASTGEIIAWVRIPTLDYNDDTVLYMVYGDSGVTTSQEDIDNTWSSAYKYVSHDGGKYDSSGNGNNGSAQGGVTMGGATGKINLATEFDGSDDWINCGHDSSLNITGDMTIQCWVYPDSTPATGDNVIISKEEASTDRQFYSRMHNTALDLIVSGDGSSLGNERSSGSAVSATTWQYINFIYTSGVSPAINIRNNTTELSTSTVSGTIPSSIVSAADNDLEIGALRNGVYYHWDGKIGEIRLVADDLSKDWTDTEYANHNSPSTFYTMGSEQSSGGTTTSTSTSTTTTSTSTSTTTTTSSSTTTTSTSTSTTTTSTSSSTTTTLDIVTLTLTDISNYMVIGRDSSNNGEVVISGTYTGGISEVQARVVDDGTNDEVVGWTTIDSSPSGGSFSGTLSNIPQGGWYNIQVRDSVQTDSTDEGSNKWGVGINILLIGQSNMDKWETNGTDETADLLLAKYSGSWSAHGNTGNGNISFGNEIISELGIPVGLLNYSVGGTSLLQEADAGNGYWLDNSESSIYDNAKDAANAIGGVEFIVWGQGETDARNSDVSESDYETGLTTFFTRVRSDITQSKGNTMQVLFQMLGRVTNEPTGDSLWQGVVNAQQDYIDGDGDAYIGCYVNELGLSDYIHLSDSGYSTAGKRMANSLLYLLSERTYYRGPLIFTFDLVSSTIIDVNIIYDGGNDFTPSSGITGFKVTDDGSDETISSAVRLDANTIRITISGSITGTPAIYYQYGTNPVITSPVLANDTLNLPLEPNSRISSTSTSTTTTSTSTTTTSTSSSTTTTLDPASGGLAFGEENPDAPEDAVSWQTWGGTGSIEGDSDWGKLQLDIGENGYSQVYDFGNDNQRQYTLTENKYGTGQGAATLQIRGSATSFEADAGTPAWDDYSGAVTENWRYVQVRTIKNS